MRVAWQIADEVTRKIARERVAKLAWDMIPPYVRISDDAQRKYLAREFPELQAMTTTTGTIVGGPTHVAEIWTTHIYTTSSSDVRSNSRKITDARWTCLVARDSDGQIVEMDPTTLSLLK